MNRETIISALKRNDKVAITGIIATAMGADEEALATALSTTRATDKFYQTVFDLVPFEVEAPVETMSDDELDEVEKAHGEPTTTDEEVEKVDHSFKDIRKAIKKGKGKKALKLIVKAKEAGARGSVLKDLTRQAKEL